MARFAGKKPIAWLDKKNLLKKAPTKNSCKRFFTFSLKQTKVLPSIYEPCNYVLRQATPLWIVGPTSIASVEVTVQLLLNSKCITIIVVYGLEACPLKQPAPIIILCLLINLIRLIYRLWDNVKINFTLSSYALERRRTKFMRKFSCDQLIRAVVPERMWKWGGGMGHMSGAKLWKKLSCASTFLALHVQL